MEGHPNYPPERLTEFLGRVAVFLEALTKTPSLGTAHERELLGGAVSELREFQLPRAQAEVQEAGDDLLPAGFSRDQTIFKVEVAERAMDDAVEPSRTGWFSPSAILRAVGKIRAVLASLKSISKWLEALDELVALAGELAKNRLGPQLG